MTAREMSDLYRSRRCLRVAAVVARGAGAVRQRLPAGLAAVPSLPDRAGASGVAQDQCEGRTSSTRATSPASGAITASS